MPTKLNINILLNPLKSKNAIMSYVTSFAFIIGG